MHFSELGAKIGNATEVSLRPTTPARASRFLRMLTSIIRETAGSAIVLFESRVNSACFGNHAMKPSCDYEM